jgi:uncharacterized protein YndB with AHSA1/START domain
MRLRDEPGNDVAPWVERETLIEATPEEVWEAITDEDRLEEWIAEEGEGESLVEFTIEAVPAGTRLTVVETPIGPTAVAAGGWRPRLARLRGSLALAPVA